MSSLIKMDFYCKFDSPILQGMRLKIQQLELFENRFTGDPAYLTHLVNYTEAGAANLLGRALDLGGLYSVQKI